MTNYTYKQKQDNEFMGSFSNRVRKYIGIEDGFPSEDPARWLLDSSQLLDTDWPNKYSDYSFIVVPASKALEYWIFQIAEDIGIEVNTGSAGVVRDQIESALGDLLGDDIDDEVQRQIETDVNYLRNFWQEYRNDIVHCEQKIESFSKAKNKVIAIYERINSITEKLLNAGLIEVS